MISKKLLILITVILAIGITIFIYYEIKTPPLAELKNIESIQDNSIEEGEEKPVEEKTTEAPHQNEADLEESETSRVNLPTMISDTIKSTLDFLFLKELHIVAIGDSLTQGIGDHTEQGGYIGILDRTINKERKIAQFENYGKRGHRTDQLLKRLEEPEIKASIKKADIILITIGANDIMKVAKENITHLTLAPFEEARIHYEQRLYQIISGIKDLNPYAHIYLLGIYNPFKQYFQDIKELDMIVNDWNQTSLQVINQFEQTTFIPIKDLFETNVNVFAEDYFHPNYHGYYLIAERVLPYLTNVEGEHHEEETS